MGLLTGLFIGPVFQKEVEPIEYSSVSLISEQDFIDLTASNISPLVSEKTSTFTPEDQNDDKLNYGINEFLKGIIETGDHLSSYLDISEKKKIQNSIKNINFEKGNFIYNNQSLPEIVFIEKK